MDRMTTQLKSANIIVVAFPMYNFSMPAIVKAWFDSVMQRGVTFGNETDGQIVISNAGKKSSDFDIKCSANSPLDLLKVIGMSQMEKELLKRYKSLVSK